MFTPEMYTEEGNQAVIRAMITVATVAETNLAIRNKDTLIAMAAPVLEAVAKLHPEIYDTEPRCWVDDRLDEICRANGWTCNGFEGFEGYDW